MQNIAKTLASLGTMAVVGLAVVYRPDAIGGLMIGVVIINFVIWG